MAAQTALSQNKAGTCPFIFAKPEQDTTSVAWTEWYVGNGTVASPQYAIENDFTFKWEKTAGGTTTEIDQAPYTWGSGSSGLPPYAIPVFPVCLDANGDITPCANWEQSNANLGDYTQGGYMGDGLYTFTATRSDNCSFTRSFQVTLGCMEPGDPNTDANNSVNTHYLNTDLAQVTFYLPGFPASKLCAQ